MKQSNVRASFGFVFPFCQIYLSIGLVFGTWIIYIPSICTRLSLSEGQLGTTFLIASFGSLLSLTQGKRICSKFGEGVVTFAGSIASSLIMLCIFLIDSIALFMVAWFFFGLAGGVFQVSLNSLVASIETKSGKRIMSRCHGSYSLGGLISTGLGTLLIVYLKNPILHISLIICITILLQFVFRDDYIFIRSNATQEKGINKGKSPIRWNSVLVGLGIVALVVLISEGAIADWSALYLQNVSQSHPEWVGLGYAGFSLSMTVFRFFGDALRKNFDSWTMILCGLCVSIIGLVMVLGKDPLFTILGLLIVGSGFSVIVPELYRKAASTEGIEPANGIAVIAGSGYLGFLIGPFLLGWIAEHSSLWFSFALLSLFILVALVVSLSVQLRACACSCPLNPKAPIIAKKQVV